MGNSSGASVPLNTDQYGNQWPPRAGDWADPNTSIDGWEIVNSPQRGDVIAQARNYTDASGHMGIVLDVDLTIISARTDGISIDSYNDVFPSQYTEPVVFRRYVGN